jgi:hypothetical protein
LLAQLLQLLLALLLVQEPQPRVQVLEQAA